MKEERQVALAKWSIYNRPKYMQETLAITLWTRKHQKIRRNTQYLLIEASGDHIFQYLGQIHIKSLQLLFLLPPPGLTVIFV